MMDKSNRDRRPRSVAAVDLSSGSRSSDVDLAFPFALSVVLTTMLIMVTRLRRSVCEVVHSSLTRFAVVRRKMLYIANSHFSAFRIDSTSSGTRGETHARRGHPNIARSVLRLHVCNGSDSQSETELGTGCSLCVRAE